MASRVPDALAALAAALKAAGLPVLDGPTVSDASMTEIVVVGFTSADDPTSVESVAALEGLGSRPNREQFTIRNFASVSNGSTGGMVAARTRAYELLAAVDDAVARDSTLQGSVLEAYVSDHTLLQQQASAGAVVQIQFGVTCDAYTTK